jgi:sigma-B regulation protein RsbU (phosphoserine phosphatase)
MSAAIQAPVPDLRSELISWRQRLESTVGSSDGEAQLESLLREVQAAIESLTKPESYGVCQVCHDLIGKATMNADPIARFCLECLTPQQMEELSKDLDRAWLIQGESLPKQNLKFNGWEVAYHYQPAGPVSGDYCDLIATETGDLYFMIGDVSGKGIAASLLMNRLHAIFRSLIGTGLSVSELVERANGVFAETTMRPYYATLVCGKADRNGDIEVCNAGHPAPLHLHDGKVTPIPATGLPLGMFCSERYESTRISADKGDRLLLYTDGLSEARNANDVEYGKDRLQLILNQFHDAPTGLLVKQVLDDAHLFGEGRPVTDDLTVMAIEMVGH